MRIKIIKLSVVGIAMGLAIGSAMGVGVYTFVYAKGYSYMTNDPQNCANCHIMNEQYDGWQKSSHKNVATCNDCHTPHDLLGKYATKASNGFWHSYYFTTNSFHEPIQLTERSREITEQSCRYCHQNMVDAISVSLQKEHTEEVSCIRCHRSVGHLH